MELAWVDFSNEDARRVQKWLRCFEVDGAIDRLGFGSLRDAISDKLFPTVSTLHNRARYLFLIAYDLRRLEDKMRKRSGSENISLRRIENDYTEMEQARCEELSKGGEKNGVHGSTLLDKDGKLGNRWLGQKPINIYWVALRELDFYVQPHLKSRAEYFRHLRELANASPKERLGRSNETEEGEISEARENTRSWNEGLPKEGTKKSRGTLSLSSEEAKFLQERIEETHGDSLYARLITEDKLFDCASGSMNESETWVDFERFASLACSPGVLSESDELYRQLEMAHSLSAFTRGCYIRFNHRLCELLGEDNEAQDRQWERFVESDLERALEFESREYRECFKVGFSDGIERIFEAMKGFREAREGNKSIDDSLRKLDAAVQECESEKKRGKAILESIRLGSSRYGINDRQNDSGLNFRLSVGCRMVADIRDGLEGSDE